MTSGMLGPTGMLVSVNVPSNAVVVVTSGLPADAAEAQAHELAFTPSTKASGVELGTYTTTSGSGSTPLGAYTVPLMLVVAGAVQVTCWVQSPTQAGAPHWLGMPPPPHV